MSDATREPGRRWRVLVAVLAIEFVVELDTSIVNIALPTMSRELHAGVSQLQWVVDSYVLVLASLLLFAGAVVDRIGSRRALLAGGCIFAAGSVAAALATDSGQLTAMRAVMGLGGALLFPATVLVLVQTFPAQERARAMGVWSAVGGLAFAFGPTVGGWLVQAGGWSAIFWINVPILAVSLTTGLRFIPRTREAHPRPPDWVGALTVVAGLGALLYAVIEAPVHGWTSSVIVGAFALAAGLLAVFVAWERRVRFPMVDARRLGGGPAVASAMAVGLTFLPMAGGLFIVTQDLQLRLGYSPLAAGVRMLPVALVFAVGATASVPVSRRIGNRGTVVLGLGLLGAGLAMLGTRPDDSGYGSIVLALVIGGAGAGLAITPAIEVMLNAVPPDSAGVGSSLNTTAMTLGTALGVAILGSILSSRLGDVAARAGAGGSAHAGTTLAGALRALARTHDTLLIAGLRHDFVSAANTAFLVGAGIAGLGAALAFKLLPRASVVPSPAPLVTAPTYASEELAFAATADEVIPS